MNEQLYMDFESYLAEKLAPEQHLAFEQRLQQDAVFRRQFEQYSATTGFLAQKFSPQAAAFRQNLQSIAAEHFLAEEKQAKVIRFRPWQYAVAATVALFFGLWFFNQPPHYSDYNQHENALFVERGAADQQLKAAQDYFNAKAYPEAVRAFEKIKPTTPELRYYYAIALIETARYTQAETQLEALRQGHSAYKDKATWYLALSKLKQNQPAQCVALLKQIPQEAEVYEKAQDLLDKLD